MGMGRVRVRPGVLGSVIPASRLCLLRLLLGGGVGCVPGCPRRRILSGSLSAHLAVFLCLSFPVSEKPLHGVRGGVWVRWKETGQPGSFDYMSWGLWGTAGG